MSSEVRVGLVGCGVVGTGVLRVLHDHARTIEARAGRPIKVVQIAVANIEKPRDPIVDRSLLTKDAAALVQSDDVDVVIELIGGEDVAKTLIRSALENGKHVVTANKAVVAEYGDELFALAEKHNVDLYFEASVAGGVPIIRTLREALAADHITAVRGILNGTSNYILSTMADSGAGFDEALKAAQDAGYAEADPTLDISGGDACHKLAILATLAFGARVKPKDILTEGIDQVDHVDIRYAASFGYAIKPMVVAQELDNGKLDLRVHPALVKKSDPLASFAGTVNAILLTGSKVGPSFLSGLGAGAEPTATSVVSDLIDVARNLGHGTHGRVSSHAFSPDSQRHIELQDPAELESRYYLRFSLRDESGALAAVSGKLSESGVSIERMLQDLEGDNATVVMLTHRTKEHQVREALSVIDKLSATIAPTHSIRIEP